MDTLRFFADPHTYITSSFHSMGTGMYNWLTMEPYKNETDEEFDLRRRASGTQLIQFVWPHISRLMKQNTSNPAAIIFNMFFNYTFTDAQRKEFAPYNKWLPRTYSRYTRAPRLRTMRWYSRKVYTGNWTPRTFHKMQYNPHSQFSKYGIISRGQNIQFARELRTLNLKSTQAWRRTMSKSNRVRKLFLSFPTNKWTLKIKATIIRYNMRHGY